jgi:glycosyltransferase involved in cell wall biosynthesis
MISVIVCSRQKPGWDDHEGNVKKTIGAQYEYIRIDNTANTYGICAAYNKGVSNANGDILAFVHEDVYFMEPGWGRVLIKKFVEDESLGLIGVVGTKYLLSHHPAWLAAGQPFLCGRVVHELKGGEKFYLSVFSWEKDDTEVVAVDGLFFSIRKTLFQRICFDDMNFDKFHFYDLDICMQIRKTHKLIVTWDILVKHLSAGHCDETWKEAGMRFLKKYKDELPASCVDNVPDSNRKIYGIDYDLKGILSQKAVV